MRFVGRPGPSQDGAGLPERFLKGGDIEGAGIDAREGGKGRGGNEYKKYMEAEGGCQQKGLSELKSGT